MSAGRCVASITCAIVKVLPEPVTPSSTWVRSWRLTPSTRSAIACGWSPFGVNSDLITSRWPPSDFSGRGGRCGVHGRSLNSGRPSRSSFSSACAVAATGDSRFVKMADRLAPRSVCSLSPSFTGRGVG